MNSKQIECFLTVAETLSFTEAGKKLFASQSTISRHIVLLEEELGFELFVRGNNFVRLTPAGALMIPAFHQMEDILTYQKKLAHYTTLGESGLITIGFLTNMNINNFFIQTIEDFKQKYPKIIMKFICFPDGNYEEALQNNEIDLFITHDFDCPNSYHFVSNKICNTNMKILYSIKHPQANKENLTIYDFRYDTFWTALGSDTENRNSLMQKVSDFYQIPLLKTIAAPNFETALINIRLGNGVAFIDELTMSSISDDLKLLSIDQAVSQIGISVVWNRKNLNPSIPLFVNTITPVELLD